MNTIDKILIVLGCFLAFFIIVNEIVFIAIGSIPDTLVQCVLGGGIVEIILTALITIAKKKWGVKDENEDNMG